MVQSSEMYATIQEMPYLPNLLTLSRIALIPVIMLFHMMKKRTLALVILLAAFITDFLDGYLARRWRVESTLGALLDPVADKTMAISFFGYLKCAGNTPGYLANTIIFRCISQLMSIPILVWWLKKPFKVKPKFHAKLATAMQFALIPLYLFNGHKWIKRVPPYLIASAEVLSFILESQIILTYFPRLFQIATDRHDTFE